MNVQNEQWVNRIPTVEEQDGRVFVWTPKCVPSEILKLYQQIGIGGDANCEPCWFWLSPSKDWLHPRKGENWRWTMVPYASACLPDGRTFTAALRTGYRDNPFHSVWAADNVVFVGEENPYPLFTVTEEEIVEINAAIKEMQKHVLAASAAHLRLTDHIQKHGADEALTGDLIAERSSIRSERLLAGSVSRGAKSRYEGATFRAREIDECSLTIRRLCKEHEGIVIVERPKDGGNDVLWRDFGAYDQNTEEPFVIVLGYDMDTNLHRIGRIVSLDGDCDFVVGDVNQLQGISGIYAKSIALRIADEIDAHIEAIRERIGSFL